MFSFIWFLAWLFHLGITILLYVILKRVLNIKFRRMNDGYAFTYWISNEYHKIYIWKFLNPKQEDKEVKGDRNSDTQDATN